VLCPDLATLWDMLTRTAYVQPHHSRRCSPSPSPGWSTWSRPWPRRWGRCDVARVGSAGLGCRDGEDRDAGGSSCGSMGCRRPASIASRRGDLLPCSITSASADARPAYLATLGPLVAGDRAIEPAGRPRPTAGARSRRTSPAAARASRWLRRVLTCSPVTEANVAMETGSGCASRTSSTDSCDTGNGGRRDARGAGCGPRRRAPADPQTTLHPGPGRRVHRGEPDSHAARS
jgi:hypothetical protein